MKILLATLSSEAESRLENNRNAAYPLGLAYLHSVLEWQGHEVKLLFLSNLDHRDSEETFFQTIADWQPQAVGFQILSMNRTATFTAIERLHTLQSGIKVIIGGVHVSIMFRQILEKFRHIFAVIGEGEITFGELIESFSGGRPLESVNGIAYYSEGKITVTRPRELIEDLNSLPEPRHEAFFDSEPARTVGHVISSRGCPFDCTFCCLKAISERRYRARSITKVVEEIASLKRKYPRLREIQFHDDTLLLDNQRIIEFCKLIIPKQLGLTFTCSARVKPVSHEMFCWMEKAGFTKIMFGLETGAAKLLDSIHKKITKEDVLNLFQTIKSYDFNVTTFLMCGFPGETDDTVQETIELVKATQKIHYNWIAGVGKLFVYPGTEVYQVMKDSGKITDDFWMTTKPVPYFTAEHDLAGLVRFEEKMMQNLSFLRILSFRGFTRHFMSVPLMISKTLLKAKNRKILLSVLTAPLKQKFPAAYAAAYKFYQKILRIYGGHLKDRQSVQTAGD